MAEYRLKLPIFSGFGTITVDGGVPAQYYEEGTSLTIAIALNSGFVSVEWFRLGVSISTSTSFSYNMPSEDTSISIQASGDYAPIDGYGLKYYYNYLDVEGNDIDFEIYQDGYGGLSTEKPVRNVSLIFGDNVQNPVKSIVGCSLDFEIIGEADDFTEFLDGGIRHWRVVYKLNSNVIFDGYLTPDFIEIPDVSGNQYQEFTAIDGLKGFDSIRTQTGYFPSGSGNRNLAISALIGCLNQSFVEQKKVNVICDIYEDRMTDTESVFEQFLTPDATIFTDGERAVYSNNGVIWNEKVFLSEAINSLVNPFLCRVFQWENEFWVVRIPDQNQDSYTGFKFNSDGSLDTTITVNSDLELVCDIDLPIKNTHRVYTEFTAILKLGILTLQAAGAVFESSFGVDNWFVGSPASTYAGRYILRDWELVNARPSNDPSSVPIGDLALVQYVSDTNGEHCRIWTTTTTAGTSDPNISYIRMDTTDSGQAFLVADEVANTLSIEFEFLLYSVSRSQEPNTFANHSVGFMVKIGAYYLYEVSTDVYGFNTTPNIVTITVPNSGSWNKVKITNVTVPTTDNVEVRLYQAILSSGERHKYSMNYRNFKLNIEENEAFTLSEIGAKAVTDLQFTSVYPDYYINIGDTETNMSTSAIKLDITDYPVSESWTTTTITSEPLLGVIVEDLANLFGRKAQILKGTAYHVNLRPYQTVKYDGKLWMIMYFKWNVHRQHHEFMAFELGPVETT